MHPRIILAAIALTLCPAGLVHAQNLEWIRQFGTIEFDNTFGGAAADGSGSVYFSGFTSGSLRGINAGMEDVVVSKFLSDGTLAWSQQFGTAAHEAPQGISTDRHGNVYVSGRTRGSLGGPNAGDNDAFLSKLSSDGTLVWTQQIGSAGHDGSGSVSAHSTTNVYVAGNSSGDLGGTNAGENDLFVSRYASDGVLAWTRQFGTSRNEFYGRVSADTHGNVFVTGNTFVGADVGDWDVLVSKFDDDGILAWSRQFGTSAEDIAYANSADANGNVYVSGYTRGNFVGSNQGFQDAFLSKFNADGTPAWTRQFGTSGSEEVASLSVNTAGHVFLAGWTTGNMAGPNAGVLDAFVTEFDADGAQLWVKQFGTSRGDFANGVSADALGNVFVSGLTEGSLGGPLLGSSDFFMAKFTVRLPTPGDTNGDGLIDINDLNNVRNEFGLTGDNLAGDLNGDFVVDSDDLNIVRSNFGATAGAAAVPEPASGFLLATSALLACCMVRRTQRPARPLRRGSRQPLPGG